jgi:2-amino-4-hydroxy-6-hydroxymethyldihydropteridine diphosphokinase
MTPAAGERVFVGLGANLGDARATLAAALQALGEHPAITVVAQSSLYRSVPVDAGGPDYINAVAELRTGLSPLQLLHVLQALETQHGRQHPYVNAPRTLDLDLLLFGQQVFEHAELTLPHPRLHLRAFVLVPLAQIAPDLIQPGLGLLRDWCGRVAEQTVDKLP